MRRYAEDIFYVVNRAGMSSEALQFVSRMESWLASWLGL